MIAALFVCLPQVWNRHDDSKTLLWPFGSGQTPAKIHQTYGQGEGAGLGSVHLHAGLDLVPEAQDRAVWSLEKGTVVRIYLGDALDNKRSGLVIASTEKPGRAFQYMHLEPDSIQLLVGDPVQVDQYLGDVRAEDSETEYPEHLHLSRLGGRYEEESIPWWQVENLSIRNPLVLIDPGLHKDEHDPEIVVDETRLLRRNEDLYDNTPIALNAVPVPAMLDVLAQVQDRSASSEKLAPYRLELVITTDGHRESFGLILDGPLPVSSDVIFDQACIMSAPCQFVFTNGNPATDAMDRLHAWCASSGKHTLEFTAWDAAGRFSQKTVTNP